MTLADILRAEDSIDGRAYRAFDDIRQTHFSDFERGYYGQIEVQA